MALVLRSGKHCAGCLQLRSQLKKLSRCSSTATKQKVQTRMKAWYIHQYGGNEEFTLSSTAKIPKLKSPSDVLVKIHAASVNPIDVEMRGGYGRRLINQMRRQLDGVQNEFPLTFGRDFSGVVKETGFGVTRFKPGDQVWGALAAHRQGTHAEYAVTGEREISLKPKSLTHVEAASIPYVATTVWSAMCTTGELTEKNTSGSRVLIHGGSGGIGTFAIQLMKAWGATVVTTCATDAIQLVESLGADEVIDYKTDDVAKELRQIEKVDLILDPIGGEMDNISIDALKPWRNSKYVSLVMPLLPSTDQYGIAGGMLQSAASLGMSTMKGFTQGRSYRWAFFIPNGNALEKIAKMVDSGKIRPVVEKICGMEDLPEVYDKVEQRHGRGKSVIDMTK